MATDVNGFEIKPDHTGRHGPDRGDYVWVLRREDDKVWGVWESRHDALAARFAIPNNQPDWFTPVPIRECSLRVDDTVFVGDAP